jgi:23S rRNA (adenine1618-N6)-methyltransferase
VARGISGFPKHLLPFPSEFTFQVSDLSVDAGAHKIDTEMRSLPIQWHWHGAATSTGVGFATENVWSRQARRKRQKVQPDAANAERSTGERANPDRAAMGVKIQLTRHNISESQNGLTVLVRWLRGRDSVLFESFCGMLKRKVEEK